MCKRILTKWEIENFPITGHAVGIPMYSVDPVSHEVIFEVIPYTDHLRGDRKSIRIPLGKQAVWKSEGVEMKEDWKGTFHREAMQEIAKDPNDFAVQALTDNMFPISADFEIDDNNPRGIHLRGFVPARMIQGEVRDYEKEDKEEDGHETLGPVESVEVRKLFQQGVRGLKLFPTHIAPILNMTTRLCVLPEVAELYGGFLNHPDVRSCMPKPFSKTQHMKILEYIKRR